ncbi:hypothetical protein [uncultured Shewanella sp.]|uniref:hypothetical protein n=1 Tax=uncultured Shewanella sp. TaxID=173975 RepID=UPI0026154DE4|nr:hypothetical protein [uncultured Shewanella sp.]
MTISTNASITAAITVEQWQQIEKEMSGVFGRVEFLLNGTKINLEKQFIAENRLGILVFINGSINHGLCYADPLDPIAQQVWRKRSKALYSAKKKAELLKGFGKRRAKEWFPNIDKKREWLEPYFPQFGSLKRQYSKLEALTLVSLGYQSQGADKQTDNNQKPASHG